MTNVNLQFPSLGDWAWSLSIKTSSDWRVRWVIQSAPGARQWLLGCSGRWIDWADLLKRVCLVTMAPANAGRRNSVVGTVLVECGNCCANGVGFGWL